MANNTTKDPVLVRISKLRKYATQKFRELFPTRKERNLHQAVLDEVKDQIYYCETLLKPLTETQIDEWLQLNNEFAVQRKARTQKGFT